VLYVGAFSSLGSELSNMLIGFFSDTQLAVNDYIDIAEAGFYSGPWDSSYGAAPEYWVPLASEEDLQRVERFVEKSMNPDTPPGSFTSVGAVGCMHLQATPGQAHLQPIQFRRSKPKVPAITFESVGGAGVWRLPSAGANVAASVAYTAGLNRFGVSLVDAPASPQVMEGHFIADASL
jgi:hypothetical protein